MIKIVLTAYLITCSLEILLALGMKIREKRGYLLILLVNLLTNPLANLLYYKLASGLGRIVEYQHWGSVERFVQWTGYDPVWILIEIMVIVCEGEIYSRFREWILHPWRYAVIANLVSALAGVLWQYI